MPQQRFHQDLYSSSTLDLGKCNKYMSRTNSTRQTRHYGSKGKQGGRALQDRPPPPRPCNPSLHAFASDVPAAQNVSTLHPAAARDAFTKTYTPAQRLIRASATST